MGSPDPCLSSTRETAIASLEKLGVGWGPTTRRDLEETEEAIPSGDAADVIRAYATKLEPAVRALTGSTAPFNLTIEHVDIAAYWAYWLDGAGSNVRMRIDVKNATFTDVEARQFALHEILGHGLQCASFSERCSNEDVPWIRLTSVHSQQQVLLEGLAQALPLFLLPDDEPLIARVRLAHYIEIARGQLHLAINDGLPIADCVQLARSLVPFWSDEAISSILSDRSVATLCFERTCGPIRRVSIGLSGSLTQLQTP